jgi:DNA repair protein RadC
MKKERKAESPQTANEPPSYAGHRLRLKEKFLHAGLDGLHDYEAVELLLTYALPRRDVKPLAKSLVNRFKGLRGVFDATEGELASVPGMGVHSTSLIKLVKALNCAYLKEKVVGAPIISEPDDVVNFLSAMLSGEKVEKFLALYLNSQNEVVAIETLHEGTLNQTAVYPRKAIELAFRHNARSIIFVHNHPSGNAVPSKSDLKLTEALERAAKSVDILVHDHVIIGRDRHYSIRDGGWLASERGM